MLKARAIPCLGPCLDVEGGPRRPQPRSGQDAQAKQEAAP